MFRFESLDIWQLAIQFGQKLFEVSDQFPQHAQYNLGNQLRSAALSISNNIAEGSGSESKFEFKSFLNYSIRSTYETASILFFARNRNYLAEARFKELYSESEILARKIRTFRKVLGN